MQKCEDLNKDLYLKETMKFSNAHITTTETLDSRLVNHYSHCVRSYALLLKEYEQSKNRNSVSNSLSPFPSIENWMPKDRVISSNEKVLLSGP